MLSMQTYVQPQEVKETKRDIRQEDASIATSSLRSATTEQKQEQQKEQQDAAIAQLDKGRQDLLKQGWSTVKQMNLLTDQAVPAAVSSVAGHARAADLPAERPQSRATDADKRGSSAASIADDRARGDSALAKAVTDARASLAKIDRHIEQVTKEEGLYTVLDLLELIDCKWALESALSEADQVMREAELKMERSQQPIYVEDDRPAPLNLPDKPAPAHASARDRANDKRGEASGRKAAALAVAA